MELLNSVSLDFVAFNYYNTMTVQAPLESNVNMKDQQKGINIPGMF